jgi:hypothetical protein
MDLIIPSPARHLEFLFTAFSREAPPRRVRAAGESIIALPRQDPPSSRNRRRQA